MSLGPKLSFLKMAFLIKTHVLKENEVKLHNEKNQQIQVEKILQADPLSYLMSCPTEGVLSMLIFTSSLPSEDTSRIVVSST